VANNDFIIPNLSELLKVEENYGSLKDKAAIVKTILRADNKNPKNVKFIIVSMAWNNGQKEVLLEFKEFIPFPNAETDWILFATNGDLAFPNIDNHRKRRL